MCVTYVDSTFRWGALSPINFEDKVTIEVEELDYEYSAYPFFLIRPHR